MTRLAREFASVVSICLVCSTAICAACTSTHKSERTNELVMNRAAIEDAFARWRAGAGGPFELLAEDATWTIVGTSPLSKTYTSKEQFLTEVIHPFNARLSSPLVPAVRRIFADSDTVIVLFDAAGVARDGLPYRNTYSWFLRMDDGQIVSAVAFFDTRAFDEFWTRVEPIP